ncbi:MAG: NAD-dependent epimerase/dehydratase family protein, partial [Marinoscillum sp.]|uniref:NAD-dependent epimerase/dehydratase family protein n=1 Tax=Marinoscillum sp. TaxID=2024838 RepID=UPI0032FE7CEA
FSAGLDINCIILRYFNPAGSDHTGELGETPSEESGFIPKIVWKAMKGELIEIYGEDYDTRDGTCVRDFIHIQDLAEAHIQALSTTDTDQVEVINVGSGNGMTVLEVSEALKRRLEGVRF